MKLTAWTPFSSCSDDSNIALLVLLVPKALFIVGFLNI